MIHHLRGKLLQKRPTFVVLDCAGVGFGVHVTPKDAERIGNTGTDASLHIYMHLTEGAAQLYGFLDEKDIEYFSLLFSVDRVGPKTAMAVVSVLPLESLGEAVSHKDPASLLRVPGVGQKTAERILFELREKIPSAASDKISRPIVSQAVDALISLGFDRRAAEKAVAGVHSSASATLESLVTASLRHLGAAGG